MKPESTVSRRRFMGGTAAALGVLGLSPRTALGSGLRPPPKGLAPLDPYDDLAKLSSNENPYGPSEKMMEAMQGAWKYSNRYGYPDGDILEKIAEHHGVGTDHVMINAGSGETLRAAGLAFLRHEEKVVGVTPTYLTVYQVASGIDADVISRPLLPDHTQDIDDLIAVTNRNYRDVGMVYIVNPNNPTGVVVPDDDIRRLLDGIPEDIPVLIDEAYHHFVEDPGYASAIPYIKEGRKVLVTRTFSKIYGMAGLRLGYGIAPPDMIDQMRGYATGSVNALVKWGGVAALQDHESERWVRETTITLRNQTVSELQSQGFRVLPSETNFFMVHTGRPAAEVRAEFRKYDVAVGRDFPPMLDHLRVSVGTEDEMKRFMTAWNEIFPDGMTAAESRSGS
ncbi:pyridoxal phosphate-dependent aminotransferase [Candidatus Palauibacter sp.]|uniref:pyridoxal phosphate-dependent aminotransferase n=1 Tax=Candidatus Palauibacter sp. TaxID=3101350 RepID=UPI003CC61D40